jgi:hypothetical protein
VDSAWLALIFPATVVGGLVAYGVWFWYRTSPAKALALVEVQGAEPFALDFVVRSSGTHRLWLRSRYQREPGASDVPVPKVSVDLQVVARSPEGDRGGYREAGGPQRLHDGVVTAGGKSQWSESPQTGRVRQVQTLWVVPNQPVGTEIRVEGRCRPDSLKGYVHLEVFVARR